MTRAEIEELLRRHHQRFLEHDTVGLAAHHLADGTLESPESGVIQGRPAIELFYRFWFTAFPDLRLEWEEELIDGNRASFFWTLTGTASGPLYGVAGRGTRITAKGAAGYDFAGGGIRSARHVFDFTGVLVAAGVLKAKPV